MKEWLSCSGQHSPSSEVHSTRTGKSHESRTTKKSAIAPPFGDVESLPAHSLPTKRVLSAQRYLRVRKVSDWGDLSMVKGMELLTEDELSEGEISIGELCGEDLRKEVVAVVVLAYLRLCIPLR